MIKRSHFRFLIFIVVLTFIETMRRAQSHFWYIYMYSIPFYYEPYSHLYSVYTYMIYIYIFIFISYHIYIRLIWFLPSYLADALGRSSQSPDWHPFGTGKWHDEQPEPIGSLISALKRCPFLRAMSIDLLSGTENVTS